MLSQAQIIRSLSEALAWFEKGLDCGVMPAKPASRELPGELRISLLNGVVGARNTRELGAEVRATLDEQKRL